MMIVTHKKQTISNCLPFVDNFEFLPFKKATHLWFAGQNKGHQLSHNLLLRLVRVCCVPLLQPQLALPAEQQHKLHLDTKDVDSLVSESNHNCKLYHIISFKSSTAAVSNNKSAVCVSDIADKLDTASLSVSGWPWQASSTAT